jgi:hypothetical protein
MTAMKFLSTEAVLFLNKVLSLPATGLEQDWEVELADPNRINEFVSFYENSILNSDQRYALMALIIASLEDLSYIKPIESVLWRRISSIILKEYELYRPLIDYWSLVDEKCSGNFFSITVLMRSLKL